MSSTAPDPAPGDLVVALNPMRAWRSDAERGDDGAIIGPGEQGLVLETWVEGRQRRLRIVRDQRTLLFSCPLRAFHRNWNVAVRR